MRISRAQIQARKDLLKKKGTSKFSGTLLKKFPSEGKIAILLADGSTKLLKADAVIQSGETIYYDEADLLGEFIAKEDVASLKKDDLLKHSSLISLVASSDKNPSKTELIREIQVLLQDKKTPLEIKDKIKTLIEVFKNEVSLFIDSKADSSVDKVWTDLLTVLDDIVADGNEKPTVQTALQELKSELFQLAQQIVTDTVGDENKIPQATKLVKAILMQGNIVEEMAKEQPDLLLKKVDSSFINEKLVPSLQKDPAISPAFVRKIQQVPKLLNSLYVMPKEVSAEGAQPLQGAGINQAPQVQFMKEEQVFISLYSKIESLLTNASIPVTAELFVDQLIQGGELSQSNMKTVEEFLAMLTPEEDKNETTILESIKHFVRLTSDDKVPPSKGLLSAIYTFQKQGSKELLTSIATMKEAVLQIKEGMQQQAPPIAKEQFTVIAATMEKITSFTEILKEPQMSAFIKKEGLAAFFKLLGIGTSPSGKADIPSLRTLSQQLQKAVVTIEKSLIEAEPEQAKEVEKFKTFLSQIKDRNGTILKHMSTIALLSKPQEQAGVQEQNFFMPIQVGGEDVTIRLTVKKEGKKKKGNRSAVDGTQVEISMELQKLGKVQSRLRLHKDKSLTVSLKSSNPEGVQWFRDNLREIYASLENTDLKSVALIIDGVKPFQERSRSHKRSRIEFTG